ncbi:MAG: hypothetical protein IJ856_03085 [Candidatus Methanomethylophilaceae archaeon]|nr:hypothetical protein [Candidatus Methanomethylophilaceae archaeon]
MMEGEPIKFRILELFNEQGYWLQDIVPIIQKEYNLESDYGRGIVTYDIVELVSAGFLNEGETVLDEEGKFKKGHLLTYYTISGLGKDMYKEIQHRIAKESA